MQNPKLDKEILAKWLGDIISEQMKKDDSDINWELVNECESYLAELYSDAVIDKEHMAQKIAKIKGKFCATETPKKQRTLRMRRAVAAALISAVILCGVVAAYALVPSFRNMVYYVLNLDKGSSVHDGGVTYTYNGKVVDYETVDELIEKESLDILYPHNLPDELKIKRILAYSKEETNRYSIAFVDFLASIEITSEKENTLIISENSEVYQNENGIVSYIQSYNGTFTAVTIHDGYVYYVTAYSEEHLTMIIDNLY